MKTKINIPSKIYKKLLQHLLPINHTYEEAAFVFSEVLLQNYLIEFNYQDWYAVKPDDYESRSAFHFELKHETNARIIKRAHDLNACIIEFHSHIDQEYIRFFFTDWKGLSEFVPHVLWRLKGKPYSAVVITEQGIDALVWIDNFNKPIGLNELKVGDLVLIPSNNSLKQINYEY